MITHIKKIGVQAFQVGSNRFRPDWIMTLITKNLVITHARKGSDGWKEPFGSATVRTTEGEFTALEGAWIVLEVYPNREILKVVSDEEFNQLYSVVTQSSCHEPENTYACPLCGRPLNPLPHWKGFYCVGKDCQFSRKD